MYTIIFLPVTWLWYSCQSQLARLRLLYYPSFSLCRFAAFNLFNTMSASFLSMADCNALIFLSIASFAFAIFVLLKIKISRHIEGLPLAILVISLKPGPAKRMFLDKTGAQRLYARRCGRWLMCATAKSCFSQGIISVFAPM